MSTVTFVAAYLGVAIFVLAVIARVLMWLRLPMHVRWELYPVAHEGKRAAHGGSYLEEQHWWQKPRTSSLFGELKVMVPEILFLVALFEHNRKLWWRSFPFHFGLYLVIGGAVLMAAGGVVSVTFPELLASTPGTWLSPLLVVVCGAGLCLGIVGALGLLHRRLTDPALRDFTAPADLFNLLFFIVTFGVALAYMVLADPDLAATQAFVTGLVTLAPQGMTAEGPLPGLGTASVLLLAALVAYIPLTHMSHFIGKYFAYHAIRWNDAPNLRGGSQEKAIQRLLNLPVSWAASHIKGDGKKTWAEAATEELKK